MIVGFTCENEFTFFSKKIIQQKPKQWSSPASIYWFKVNNETTRTMWEICSKFNSQKPQRHKNDDNLLFTIYLQSITLLSIHSRICYTSQGAVVLELYCKHGVAVNLKRIADWNMKINFNSLHLTS